METNQMFELADKLKILREQKHEMDQVVKDLVSQIEATEFQLAEMMALSETQNFTRSGTMFYLSSKTYASAVSGSKDELFTALREQGYSDLIYETVNANSLSAFVREQISENEDELPEWLDGLVNVFEKTTVGVRKSR